MKNKTDPVVDEKGDLKEFTIKVSGRSFHCQCGCNVFHKPDKNDPMQYECNGCESRFHGG